MQGVRLILVLHDHQPVGNFDDVFESAYRLSYLPFLEVLEDYPEIPFVLHTSGPLMEWLAQRQPDYVARVRKLVAEGRVEVLTGGFYEPIMTMVPHRDRVGQITSYTDYLANLFGSRPRGMWVPERVWEQGLVSAFREAGVEYTVLDDFHFERAGLTETDLLGYYLTENDGRLLKVFPGSERLRYLIPFQEPHATYEYLQRIASEHPGATVVFADDGEKFGSWPETFAHVYTNGWLRRFCDMIVGNRDWIQPTTLARAVDETLPLGKVYLPDSSYREMTEWALRTERLLAYQDTIEATKGDPAAERLRPFLRAGGTWRNFLAKYPESDEMYARMLGLSRRLDAVAPDAAEGLIATARTELYQAQCNCPYWHGAFGGLYLPHLRNAIYRHLIAAHNALDAAEGLSGPRAALDVGDFNLDARKEITLQNDRLIAFVRPALGGHIYELDARRAGVNVLATLDRRPEPYHRAIAGASHGVALPDTLKLKERGLDQLLVYDRHPRKALVDHIYPMDVTLDDLISCRDIERGDFAGGAYLAETRSGEDWVALRLSRPGMADGDLIQVRKTIRLTAESAALEVDYELEDLPTDRPIHFAIEINIAAMAGHADDRYYSDVDGKRLGMLDARLELDACRGVRLTDEWLDLAVGLNWSRPGGVWCHPIATVSQSEGGCESVYQSSAVVLHWVVTGDAARRWDLKLMWTLDSPRIAPGTLVAPRVAVLAS